MRHGRNRRRTFAVWALAIAITTGCGGGTSHRAGGTSKNVAAPLLSASVASTPASSTPALSTPAPLAPPQAGPRTVTVLGSGDVLIHPPLWEQAAADAKAEGKTGYDFGSIYAGVAAVTKAADLAVCEMETPLAPPEGPFVGWPNFNAPPQVLSALKAAGYDSCTTASNHTLDQGYTQSRVVSGSGR